MILVAYGAHICHRVGCFISCWYPSLSSRVPAVGFPGTDGPDLTLDALCFFPDASPFRPEVLSGSQRLQKRGMRRTVRYAAAAKGVKPLEKKHKPSEAHC